MSMIELGFLLFCTGMAVVGWVVGSHLWVEWYYRLLSAVVGAFIPVVLSRLVVQAGVARVKHHPPYPACENGVCRWDDYHAAKAIGADVEFVCKCGMRYVKSGQRFFKLSDEGKRQPYKVLSARHQWEDDIQG